MQRSVDFCKTSACIFQDVAPETRGKAQYDRRETAGLSRSFILMKACINSCSKGISSSRLVGEKCVAVIFRGYTFSVVRCFINFVLIRQLWLFPLWWFYL